MCNTRSRKIEQPTKQQQRESARKVPSSLPVFTSISASVHSERINPLRAFNTCKRKSPNPTSRPDNDALCSPLPSEGV